MRPYFEEDGITIYHGDCREVFPSLLNVTSVITDPPYGVGLDGKRAKQRGGGVSVRNDLYIGFDDSADYVVSVVVPVISALRERARRIALTPGSRNLWLYPPADDVGCFFSAAGTGMGRWGFTCMQPILYYGADPYLERSQGSRPNSHGQTYPNDANQFDHPCAKPIRMWRWLVARASGADDTILDPFMGSGTTLRAAKDLGRKAIGIEIEEKYCQVAAERLSQKVLQFL